MIKALIIEDSRLARSELKEQLKSFAEIELVGEAVDAFQAKTLIEKLMPDLLFLDIHMPGKNGFELLQELEEVPAVIFTTAFDEYAIQSFEYNTIDYLLKPISKSRLQKAVEKALQSIDTKKSAPERKLMEDSRIFVKDGDKCWFVTIGDVRFLESKGNYTQIHFDQNRPLVLKSLQHFDDLLDSEVFFRANRAQIINIKYVAKVSEWFKGRLKITLSSGEEVEISRRQTLKVKELFGV